MKRFPFLALLTLALPNAGVGESITVHSSDFVERVRETLRDQVTPQGFEGAEAAIDPEHAQAERVEIYFGARPNVGQATTDFEAAGSYAPALPTGQPIGVPARGGPLVRFDATGTSTETEARAMVTVARGNRTGGGTGRTIESDAPPVAVPVGLSRMLADLCSVDPRFRDALEDDAPVELPLQAKF